MAKRLKVFVLGNSHVACLKRGWDEISQEFPEFDLKFFAKRGGFSMKVLLNADKTALIASTRAIRKQFAFTSGTDGSIRFCDYDLGLIVGQTRELRLPVKTKHSEEQKLALVSEYCAKNRATLLPKLLRSATDMPIYFAPEPMPVQLTPQTQLDYHGGIDLINQEFFSQFGTKLLTQPEITISDGFGTKAEYSTESKRLQVHDGSASGLEHKELDLCHMNSKYGALFLQKFFNELPKV